MIRHARHVNHTDLQSTARRAVTAASCDIGTLTPIELYDAETDLVIVCGLSGLTRIHHAVSSSINALVGDGRRLKVTAAT